MNRFTVYLIYNLLLPVALALGFPRFVIKGIQRGGLTRNFWQRLGFYNREIRDRLNDGGAGGNIWIHAVSVGEVLVALKLIRALAGKEPGRRFVLSTTTTTGFAIAEQESGDSVTVIHNPVDLPFVVGRAIKQIRPDRLVLVEAEVWPNLVRKTRARGVPVALVNARLSGRSERRFRKFAALTQPVFSLLDQVCVPFERDIDRWELLGVDRDRIELTGSVKFDDEAEKAEPPSQEKVNELSEWIRESGFGPDGPFLLAASTHAGEEALIGRVWLELRKDFPDLQYIAVPRHAERAREVGRELKEVGIAPVFRRPVADGERGGENGLGPDAPRCAVSNTTGELRAWYVLADVVVVGKSFLAKGGQNPVEPVTLGCPVVVGPNMQNFRDVIADLVRSEGILKLPRDPDESPETYVAALREAVRGLLNDLDEATKLAARGGKALSLHNGAANRTAEAVLAVKTTE